MHSVIISLMEGNSIFSKILKNTYDLSFFRSLARLFDTHVFFDSEFKIGNAILELGRVDALVLSLSKHQILRDLHEFPDDLGSTLYRLLTDPDNVNLEFLSTDLFMVRVHLTAIFNSQIRVKLELNPNLKI